MTNLLANLTRSFVMSPRVRGDAFATQPQIPLPVSPRSIGFCGDKRVAGAEYSRHHATGAFLLGLWWPGRGFPAFSHREALLARPGRAVLRPEAGPSVVTRPSMPAVGFVAICRHVAGGRGRGDERLPISPDVCHHDRGDMVQLAWRGSCRHGGFLSRRPCHHGGFPSWKGLNAGTWRRGAW